MKHFLTAAMLGLMASSAMAATISISHTDFTQTPVFNSLNSFSFTIEVQGSLAPGAYVNPALNSVDYAVNGTLTEDTPSGFSGFNLVRSIGGIEFYDQGSSIEFVIAATADLTDGAQVTDFASFTFNGRELNTGRYHPALLQFTQSGTGSIQNSNNSGGINPGSGNEVNVDFGDEYIVNLNFQSAVVPVPAAAWLFGSALGLLGWLRRRMQ